MRRLWLVSVLLLSCMTASMALAARDTATATFESLTASGISGQATLRSLPTGGTEIHGQLTGLEPGVAYMVALFPDNQTCTTGTVSQQVIEFTANPAGIATFNAKVSNVSTAIGSLSVQLGSDQSLQAGAAVIVQ